MNKFDVTICLYNKEGDIDLAWIAPVGIGHLAFKVEDGKIICTNEGMSRKFVKAVLNKLVDKFIMENEQWVT